MNLRKGSKVWVEDKDLAWVAAEVVSDSVGRHVQVLTATGKKVIIDFSYGSVVCFETMSFGFFILFLKFGVAFFFFFSIILQVLAAPERVFLRATDDEEEHGGVDDMTKLTYLNEPGVLYNLERRYALNDIYVS